MLKQLADCSLAACLPTRLFAEDFWSEPRELWLIRHETDEQLRAVYWPGGGLDVMHLTLLFIIMHAMQGWLEMNSFSRPIIVNIGYRTHETNARLRRESAARNSMHL